MKKKNEKAKYELIRLISLVKSFTALDHGRRICLLEFAIVLKLQTIKKIPGGKCSNCK